jgi:hypothetical protein
MKIRQLWILPLGIAQARAGIIAFLDSDNIWATRKTGSSCRALAQAP